MSLLITHPNMWICSLVSAHSRGDRVGHRYLTLKETRICDSVSGEGHPRSNGDGPLTRNSFSRNERG